MMRYTPQSTKRKLNSVYERKYNAYKVSRNREPKNSAITLALQEGRPGKVRLFLSFKMP